MEGFIGKRRKRRKRYGEYTAGRAHRAAAAAVAGERPPYHLTYSRRAAAGTLHGQGNPAGKEAEGRHKGGRGMKGQYRSRVYTERPDYADFDPPEKFQAIKG